jgi:ABC-2 type transport system ATP-binding protein
MTNQNRAKEVAIKIDSVSKDFNLPHEVDNNLKQKLLHPLKRNSTEKQHALKDISFNINKGDFFGIVGRNGSGKSTLLKIIAEIYTPTKGNVTVNGSLTPFIELGVGFNPELTGRENVYLNGAMLGFSKKEVRKMYAEIVEFAELEKFMDQKLKNYSSGMQIRLAFSVAIRAKSDILLLDEVLAVGDEAFQNKCLSIFEDYKASKKTVVLVTHSMAIVEKYCNRAVMLDHGELEIEGSPSKVARMYTKDNQDSYTKGISKEKERRTKVKPNQYKIKIKTSKKGESSPSMSFKISSDLEARIEWDDAGLKKVKGVGLVIIKKTGEIIYATNTLREKKKISGDHIKYSVNLKVSPGRYKIDLALLGKSESDILDYIENAQEFLVENDTSKKWEGVVKLDHTWK